MGHIRHQVSTGLVSDFTHSSVINVTGISTSTSNDDLGAVQDSVSFKGVVIDLTSLLVEAVGEGFKVRRDGRNLLGWRLVTVRQAKQPKNQYLITSFDKQTLLTGHHGEDPNPSNDRVASSRHRTHKGWQEHLTTRLGICVSWHSKRLNTLTTTPQYLTMLEH